MDPTKSASHQAMRLREYTMAVEDMREELDGCDTGLQYIQSLRTDYGERKNSFSYKKLNDAISRLERNAVKDDLNSYHFLFISQAFRDGFLVGLEANRLLIGGDFDDITQKFISGSIRRHIEASKGDAIATATRIEIEGGQAYHSNMSAVNEKRAASYNAMTNPFDDVVDEILDDIYEKSDDVQRSFFYEGFGYARKAQTEHQKNTDREFRKIHTSIDFTTE